MQKVAFIHAPGITVPIPNSPKHTYPSAHFVSIVQRSLYKGIRRVDHGQNTHISLARHRNEVPSSNPENVHFYFTNSNTSINEIRPKYTYPMYVCWPFSSPLSPSHSSLLHVPTFQLFSPSWYRTCQQSAPNPSTSRTKTFFRSEAPVNSLPIWVVSSCLVPCGCIIFPRGQPKPPAGVDTLRL